MDDNMGIGPSPDMYDTFEKEPSPPQMPPPKRRVNLVTIGPASRAGGTVWHAADARKSFIRKLKRKANCDEEASGTGRDPRDDTEMVEPVGRVTRSHPANGDSAHGKTRQSKRKREEEPTPGHSWDLTDDTEMVEPEHRVTRGLPANGDSAHGKTGHVRQSKRN